MRRFCLILAMSLAIVTPALSTIPDDWWSQYSDFTPWDISDDDQDFTPDESLFATDYAYSAISEADWDYDAAYTNLSMAELTQDAQLSKGQTLANRLAALQGQIPQEDYDALEALLEEASEYAAENQALLDYANSNLATALTQGQDADDDYDNGDYANAYINAITSEGNSDAAQGLSEANYFAQVDSRLLQLDIMLSYYESMNNMPPMP